MRSTIVTIAVIAGMVGGGLVVAGTAGAVSDDATCSVVKQAVEDYSAGSDAIDGAGADAAARSGELWRGLIAKFSDAAADADDGQVKSALNVAVAQMNRVVTPAETDLKTMMSDPAFRDAMTGLDSACGF
ncbi:hypothetical protein [Nocardia terpenica]|uniref:Uncharacterized protein n=1 Tax=Nocardia terpenica TaxID=455432 RepID=A0A164N150_9NOCA|nr:hypothetical protein [Nocardia terpenica]KZM73871.1 hypothetical protein AWN90_35655 [Nocardia terpenica]NQE86846.1 hypothetical protein [Nocardia terpenica]